MKIKSIAVEVKETVSLPGYANTSQCVRYEADLSPDDNPEKTYRELLTLAKFKVYHEIDEALEREDEPPKFHMGDRFDVLSSGRLRGVAVVPTGFDAPTSWGPIRRGFTENKAKAFAEKYAAGYGYAVMPWSEAGGLPGLAEREMTGNNYTGPEPDYCEECHEPIGGFDQVHTLCDDCCQPEEAAAQIPGEPDPDEDPICPKCDPDADLGRGHVLCYAHSRTDKELE